MMSTPVCPSSWNARMRWSWIARPTWMSGEVTSIPSLTLSGRPSASLRSSSSSRRTWKASWVSSAMTIGRKQQRHIVEALLGRRGEPRGRRRRIRKLRLLVLLVILLLLGTASFAYGLVTALAGEIPTLDPARYHRVQNSYIYASDGRVLAILRGSEARRVVSSSQIADVMKQAIVAVEDRRFFAHHGIDLHGILR